MKKKDFTVLVEEKNEGRKGGYKRKNDREREGERDKSSHCLTFGGNCFIFRR